jgi:hypothetical protein
MLGFEVSAHLEIAEGIELRAFAPEPKPLHVRHMLDVSHLYKPHPSQTLWSVDRDGQVVVEVAWHVLPKKFVQERYTPVALQYSTLAFGSSFCSSTTAAPTLVPASP